MSLLDATERFASIDRSALVLDAPCCLQSQDRFSECNACYGVCPVKAITPGKPLVLDAARCDSGLACLVACPVGTFSADDAVRPLLNSVAQLELETLELVCTQNPNPERGLPAPSTGIRLRGWLAGLGSGTYLALASLGPRNIIVRSEECVACKWASLYAEIESQVRHAQDFLSLCTSEASLTCVSTLPESTERPIWNADNPPLSRRGLFQMLARQGQVDIARAMENRQGKPGRRAGRNYLRIAVAVERLPGKEERNGASLAALGFARLSVSEGCTACGACARACPSGALHLEKTREDTRFVLQFSARQCVGCDLCPHVCVPAGVSVDRSPTFAQVFGAEIAVLQERELVKCKRCGGEMAKPAGNTGLCSLCEFRESHPFGSMLPPSCKRTRAAAPPENK